jgi:malate dehydrogenase
MAIMSNGDYGAPKDLIYSFPVTIKNKQWSVVKGLDMDEFSKGKLDLTGKELLEERDEALLVCQD